MLVNMTKQVVHSGLDLLGFVRKGQVAKGMRWVTFRNRVSLQANINNADRSTYHGGGFSLKDDGFAALPSLSSATCDSLVRRFLSAGGFASLPEANEHWRAKGVVRPANVNMSSDHDLMQAVFRETGLIGIVCEHLGLEVDQMSFHGAVDILLRLNREVSAATASDFALLFHRDVDSRKFVKVFFYLKDIEEGEGHHEVFLRSHRNLPASLRFIRRYPQEVLLAKGGDRFTLKKVTGPRGFGFIENTTAFHRGTVPVKGDRVMLSLEFADIRAMDYYTSHVRLADVLR